MVITELVYHPDEDADSQPHHTAETTESVASRAQATPSSSNAPQVTVDGLQSVRESLSQRGVSQRATEVIMQSWRQGTKKQYQTFIKRWHKFCDERGCSHFQPDVTDVLDFLVTLFDAKLGYSAINTARCALSTFITLGHFTAGSHPLVTRFLKGVYNQRPSLPRYSAVWDASIMIEFLKKMSPAKFLSLEDLSLKLTMLMSLVSAQRGQSLHLLSLSTMKASKHMFIFQLTAPVKNSRPGVGPPTLEFRSYAPDKRICVYHYIKQYIDRTRFIRKSDNFLISFKKPHNSVSRDTISRWIRNLLSRAGIDKTFKPHSTRAASVSAAARAQVPVDDILQAAGWSSCKTFATYYKKQIKSDTGRFQAAVLSNR